MKRALLLLACAAIFSLALSAQTDKGWRSVGGTGRLTLDFKNKSHYFSLAPELYWFVGEDFALGTDFGVSLAAMKANDSTSSSVFSTYVTPGVRYYFRTTEESWRPYVFGNGGFELYASNIKVNGNSSTSDGNGFRGYSGTGVGWFFSDHAAFDIRLYLVDYTRNDIYFNPSFAIGIQAFFD